MTTREYLRAFHCASEALGRDAGRRGAAYRHAVESLRAGHPARAARALSAMLQRRPGDPALHRMLGVSHFCSGRPHLAARHLETALRLLARAEQPGIPLVRTFEIEFEAALVRLQLVAVYDLLDAHVDVVRCLRQCDPLAWPR